MMKLLAVILVLACSFLSKGFSKEVIQFDNSFGDYYAALRILISNDGSNYNHFCPLGAQNGWIADSQFSASSEYPNTAYNASGGRLDSEMGWFSANDIAGEWLQIDLLYTTTVTGIITQGR